MLKISSKLLGRDFTAPFQPITEADENLSDAQILKEYFAVSKNDQQAFRRFITLITEQLGVAESRRLTRLAVSHLRPGDTASDAILNGILDGDGQRHGKWLLMQLDWKAVEEVEWQAQELLAVAGVPETWRLQGGATTTVPQALAEFSAWVKPWGYRLLQLDFGDDAYYALLVLEAESEEIIRAAEDAGLSLQ